MELLPITEHEVLESLTQIRNTNLLYQAYLTSNGVELDECNNLTFNDNFLVDKFVDFIWISGACLEMMYIIARDYPNVIREKINRNVWLLYYAALVHDVCPDLSKVIYTLRVLIHLGCDIFSQEFYESIAQHFCHRLKRNESDNVCDYLLNLFLHHGVHLNRAKDCVNQSFNEYAMTFYRQYYDELTLFDIIKNEIF